MRCKCRRGDIELQFVTTKGYDPAQPYSGTYVLTGGPAAREAVRDGLRRAADLRDALLGR